MQEFLAINVGLASRRPAFQTAGGGDVKWNFAAKFIIDKNGNVRGCFLPTPEPTGRPCRDVLGGHAGRSSSQAAAAQR